MGVWEFENSGVQEQLRRSTPELLNCIAERDRLHAAGYIKKRRGTTLLLAVYCLRLTAYDLLLTTYCLPLTAYCRFPRSREPEQAVSQPRFRPDMFQGDRGYG